MTSDMTDRLYANPTRDKLHTDIEDPKRVKELTEKDEPKHKKLTTDTAEPNRAKLRTDKYEPKSIVSTAKTLHRLPVKMSP